MAHLTLDIRQLWVNGHITNTAAFPFGRVRIKLPIGKTVQSPCEMNQHVFSSVFFKHLSFSYIALVFNRLNIGIHKFPRWKYFARRNMIKVFLILSREYEISFIQIPLYFDKGQALVLLWRWTVPPIVKVCCINLKLVKCLCNYEWITSPIWQNNNARNFS